MRCFLFISPCDWTNLLLLLFGAGTSIGTGMEITLGRKTFFSLPYSSISSYLRMLLSDLACFSLAFTKFFFLPLNTDSSSMLARI